MVSVRRWQRQAVIPCLVGILFWLGVEPIAAAAGGDGTDGPSIRFHGPGSAWPQGAVEVEDLSPHQAQLISLETSAEGTSADPLGAWRDRLTVHVVDRGMDAARHTPPVLGSYRLEGRSVVFTPRFPWVADQRYLVRWRPPGAAPDAQTVESLFTWTTTPNPPSTRVVDVFPSAPVVPANLLKVYLQFSQPMTRGVARHHLRVLRDGVPIPSPFVAPEHELWNPTADRLTLFFDPGRLKRGVAPNQTQGAPLEVGHRYRLEVDADWPDAQGAPLVDPFEHTWRVEAADRRSPDPSTWRLDLPRRPTQPLAVHFPEPLDRALLQHALSVHDSIGRPMDGHVTVDRRERRWQFVPTTPWKDGSFLLRVHPVLEDLAGNRPRRLFDEPLTEADAPAAEQSVAGQVIERHFSLSLIQAAPR